MPPAKNKATDLPWDTTVPEETPEESNAERPSPSKPVDAQEWIDYLDDLDTQWIEYREPITSQVDVPGQGMTTVQDHKIHRVPINEWPAYEKALNESKKGL